MFVEKFAHIWQKSNRAMLIANADWIFLQRFSAPHPTISILIANDRSWFKRHNIPFDFPQSLKEFDPCHCWQQHRQRRKTQAHTPQKNLNLWIDCDRWCFRTLFLWISSRSFWFIGRRTRRSPGAVAPCETFRHTKIKISRHSMKYLSSCFQDERYDACAVSCEFSLCEV